MKETKEKGRNSWQYGKREEEREKRLPPFFPLFFRRASAKEKTSKPQKRKQKEKKLTRADDRPGRQLRQRRHPGRADQRVAHVLPRQVARQHGALGEVGRHVLHRVHGDVDAAVEQRVVDLLGEEPLAADVREGLSQDLVSRGLDDADLEGAVLGEVGEGGLSKRGGGKRERVGVGVEVEKEERR